MGSKTLVNVILIVSTWSITKAEQFSPDRPSPKPNLYPPEKVPWHSWVNHISNVHLTDMSAELVRDATYKLEIAYKIQKKYRSGYEFNIGIIVNNLHNYFDRMLLMYRDYSNLTLWRNFARNTSVFINGFHQIQGMYHKIRFEKSVFSALVRKKQKDTEEMMKILKAKQPDHPILHGIDQKLNHHQTNCRFVPGPEDQKDQDQTYKGPPPVKPAGRRMQNLNEQFSYDGETPDVAVNTELDHTYMKPGYSDKKPGYSDINMKPGYSDMQLGYSDINMKPGESYKQPEKARDFVRPRISLGGRYSGPYQGLPVAKVTKQTTKKRLWQYKRPLY